MPTTGTAPDQHSGRQASVWVQRWTHLAKPGGRMLDIACGHGRHMAWFAARGFEVTGVDRSAEAVQAASAFGKCLQADIENANWPLQAHGKNAQFEVIVVTNYLWRPLFPTILQSLAPGGLLLYETFAAGNETVGKPSRPDFLLQPAELLQVCQGLEVVAYENGFLPQPERYVQRIAALKPSGCKDKKAAWGRHPLSLE
jgi:SAM-dependent methyltransferase